jgi:hypothetical protein
MFCHQQRHLSIADKTNFVYRPAQQPASWRLGANAIRHARWRAWCVVQGALEQPAPAGGTARPDADYRAKINDQTFAGSMTSSPPPIHAARYAEYSWPFMFIQD